jgi:hypothetical protein
MASMIPNTFTTWELTEKEVLRGSIFNIEQRQVLQNQLSIIAEEKLEIAFDVNSPNEFVQLEAFKSGQIELITYLLAASESAEQELPLLLNPDLQPNEPSE